MIKNIKFDVYHSLNAGKEGKSKKYGGGGLYGHGGKF